MDENKREELVSDDGLREILRVGVSDPDSLSAEALEAIAAPFKTSDDRRALAAAGIGLNPSASRRHRPAASVPRHPRAGPLRNRRPDPPRRRRDVRARPTRHPPRRIEGLPGAGHFLQEEVPGVIATRLERFFAG
jgi:pimeloyl-ACP methyl ester carboxylesterase